MKRQSLYARISILALTYFFLLPRIGIASEPYDFVSDVITSFELCYIADDRIKNANNDSLPEQMKNIVVFTNEIKAATAWVEPYLKSNNEIIKQCAKMYYNLYTSIVQNNGNLLTHIESILNEPEKYASKEGTMIRVFSELQALNEELWRLLLQVTAMSTHALVDQDKTEGGKLCCLNITGQERKNLVLQIEGAFGSQVKQGPKAGQLPLEGSASLLWFFLNKPWKPSDLK